jgi:replicative DNA helicase
MSTIEQTILSSLVFNEEYTRKVLPYLKPEYFQNEGERKTFDLFCEYMEKYNRLPTIEALTIDLQKQVENINEHVYKTSVAAIEELHQKDYDEQWLLDSTEQFCQEKAVYHGIMQSLEIIDDKTGKKSRGMIPQILTNALAVSFDTNIGHDWTEDFEARYLAYHAEHLHIPFHIDLLNKITKGGVVPKTLNCFLAPTGVGKSLVMCDLAAQQLKAGYNVLYITLEMSEEKIGERIDANLLDVTIDDLLLLPKEAYLKKINRVREQTKHKLIIKEYPTAGGGATHFRHLLHELKIKKNFVPDIVYIDYINICMSSRLRLGSSINSYLYIKSIAEELRGLAVEANIPIVTATQTNREGAGDSDFDMTSTSESFGLPMTLDLMIAIRTSEELAALGQYRFTQLKNRYSDVNIFKRFDVGVNYAKMQLYDIEEYAQEYNRDDKPNLGTQTGPSEKNKRKGSDRFAGFE